MCAVAARHGKQKRSLDSLNSQWEAIQESGLGRNLITESAWREELPHIFGPDSDDFPHAAAAIASGVNYLVTQNLRDFNGEFLISHRVRLVNADEFLLILAHGQEVFMIEILRKRISEFSKPGLTLGDYLQGFSKITPKFTDHIRRAILAI